MPTEPSLLPMVDMVGTFTVRHGERGDDLDPDHPEACLCGWSYYLMCPDGTGPDSVSGMILSVLIPGTDPPLIIVGTTDEFRTVWGPPDPPG